MPTRDAGKNRGGYSIRQENGETGRAAASPFFSSSGTLLPFPPFPIKLFLIKECFPVDGGVLQFFHVLFHLFVSDL